MAVESRHISANIRFNNMERDSALTLHRVRPNIETPQVTLVRDAVQQVTGDTIASIAMTVTTELLEA